MTQAPSGSDGSTTHRAKRGRSPSYPGIDLKEAIAKAKVLFDEEDRHKAPVDIVMEHWGYSHKSGAGQVALAALKKFGLIEDEGSGPSRKAGLSKDGLAIVIDEDPDSDERMNLIRRAALKPTIHAELWHEYKDGLPSDANFRTKLMRDRGFSRSGAEELIQEFKSTIEFAKLSESDSVPDNGDDGERDDGDKDLAGMQFERDLAMNPAAEKVKPPAGFQPPASANRDLRMYRLPLMRGEGEALLQLPDPISEASYRQLLAMLEVMKPGIIEPDAAPVTTT